MPDYLRQVPEGVILHLKVLPRSSRNQFAGIHNGELKLKLTAPPVEGAANKCCCDYLAKVLNVSVRAIEMIAGASSQHKKILIKGMGCLEAAKKLAVKDGCFRDSIKD